MLSGLFPIQAPIRALSVKQTEHKKVAAEVFDEITCRAMPMSLFSTCTNSIYIIEAESFLCFFFLFLGWFRIKFEMEVANLMKGKVWKLGRRRRRWWRGSEWISYLHDPFHPSPFIVVLIANDCGVRKVDVPMEEEEMVSKHDQQPTWYQYQIQVLLSETHYRSFLCSAR